MSDQSLPQQLASAAVPQPATVSIPQALPPQIATVGVSTAPSTLPLLHMPPAESLQELTSSLETQVGNSSGPILQDGSYASPLPSAGFISILIQQGKLTTQQYQDLLIEQASSGKSLEMVIEEKHLVKWRMQWQ